MLTLILIDLRYKKNVVFNFEEDSNCQNHSSSDSYNMTKKISQAKFSIFPTGRISLDLNGWFSNILNCSITPNKDFCGKLANIIITFVYLSYKNWSQFTNMLGHLKAQNWIWITIFTIFVIDSWNFRKLQEWFSEFG